MKAHSLASGSAGYVIIVALQPGFLNLNPGPLYAIDGDDGINEEITYKILGGELCMFALKV